MAAKAGKSSKATKVAKSLKSPKTPKVDKSLKSLNSKKAKDFRLKTGLDEALTKKAVEALLKYHAKQSESTEKQSLFGNDQPIQVQLSLLRSPNQGNPKPIRVLIPHPLFKLADKNDEGEGVEEEPEICLIVKEESKPWCQEMIERFPEHMGCVKKVLGLQSLRKKHAQYEQRRELLQKYNFFMADDRILPMLSKALGKEFFKAKKLPIPINLNRKEALPFAIQKALSATYMTISAGTCITIRAGHTAMSPEKLVANIMEISKNAVPKVPHKWANIQNISIKTPESTSLPIYSKTPEVLRELAELAGIVENIDPPVADEDSKENKEDEVAKKKREMKSPLLRALKKQRQDDKQKEKETKGDTPKPKKQNQDDETRTSETTPKRKKRSSSVGSAKDKTSTKRDEPENSETAKSSPAKKRKGSSTPESSKKSATPSSDKKSKESAGSGAKKEFVASKKFKGSKKGYVFKMGKQGVGYYVDKKPVVDQMAMDAIARMGKNKNRRGGQKKNKYKGTRRF